MKKKKSGTFELQVNLNLRSLTFNLPSHNSDDKEYQNVLKKNKQFDSWQALNLDDEENQPPQVQTVKIESSPARRSNLSKTIQNQLTEIFQKIGTKDETKEGLNLLYDFIQENPEADIDPFLKKCSSFFQGYIKNALKDIKENRESSRNLIGSYFYLFAGLRQSYNFIFWIM